MASKVNPTEFHIDKSQERWQLQLPQSPEFKPFYVDFTSGSYYNIFKKGVGKKDPLAKAVGIKSGTHTVLDLTAGWLKDTWMLLNLGCQVTACEKNNIVYSLIGNAIEVDRSFANYEELFARLELLNVDSLEFLRNSDLAQWDAVYIDPMFPQRTKSALSGKEMQILQELIAEEDMGEEILTEALHKGASRVVVKRPLKGPQLLKAANFSVESKASRFDVYINKH